MSYLLCVPTINIDPPTHTHAHTHTGSQVVDLEIATIEKQQHTRESDHHYQSAAVLKVTSLVLLVPIELQNASLSFLILIAFY